MWGLNLQPRDRESHAPSTEPARYPTMTLLIIRKKPEIRWIKFYSKVISRTIINLSVLTSSKITFLSLWKKNFLSLYLSF